MKNFLIITGIVAIIGVGAYFYLKNKKKESGTSGSGLTDDLLNSVSPNTQAVQPAAPQSAEQKEIVEAAKDFYSEQVKTYFSDAPVPIPGDLSTTELNNLQKFCSLPTGTPYLTKASIGSLPSIGPVNYNTSQKWGLSNTLFDRAGYAGTRQDYLNKLKAYFKC